MSAPVEIALWHDPSARPNEDGRSDNTEFITVPVPRDVEREIGEWFRSHYDELRTRLAELGFDADRLLEPSWQQALTREMVDDLRWVGSTLQRAEEAGE